VLVVGAGAVGLGVASCLHKAGVSLDLVARPETAAALRANGLRRTGILGQHRVPAAAFAAAPDRETAPVGAAAKDPEAACTGPAAAARVRLFPALEAVPPAPYALALVCVKSFDSASVAAELSRAPALCGGLGGLVLLQNGYGNGEIFAARFPAERILLARVITGFRRRSLHQVEITVHAAPVHVGLMRGGPGEPEARTARVVAAAAPATARRRVPAATLAAPSLPAAAVRLCRALTRGDLPARVSRDIQADVWAKILYNAMLNPLGALLDATYGELGSSPWTRRLMARLAAEAFEALAAAGVRTHWPDARAFLRAFHRSMLPPTRDHESSMLQDIRAGQRTEVDALNGAIVELGRRHGVATPCNDTIVGLLHALEERARPRPA
jgi:2-dehydropantoate 2-reductase